MSDLINLYKYKYSRKNCYIDLILSEDEFKDIKKIIDNSFDDLLMSNEYKVAYKTLQILFDKSLQRTHLGFVSLRINKCYLKYLKNLYFSYYSSEESLAIKELILDMQFFMNEKNENISRFTILNEKTKIDILSSI